MRGKRTDEKNRVIYARDHPRLCGEKELLKLEFDTIMGSPPPMRGKVVHGSTLRTTNRITPAYAGKR